MPAAPGPDPSGASPGPAAVFVYGTLMPGRLRRPLVADRVARRRPGTVAGTLYDTGRGYPALAPGRGIVHGWLLELAPDRVEATLAELDVVEGPGYRRVVVVVEDGTPDGTPAHTYLVVGSTKGFQPIPSGRWAAATER